MALPLPPGLTPAEIAFMCEMELVTVIPRQRLEGLDLLGGPTPPLNPPYRADLPLWLALLLKRQRRANISPPPWLNPQSLEAILRVETELSNQAFSPPAPLPPSIDPLLPNPAPPFVPSATYDAPADALPYHWLELGEILLEAASDDFETPDQVRRLLRDLREIRMEKLRKGAEVLDAGGGVKMNGVGAMEVGEGRAFITGVIDGLRKIGASKEQAKREREAEERENGFVGTAPEDEDEMEL
ncbi:GINS complex, PSF2 component [Viridothelium virens]|uniref:DNA replication complex GINS protein PSF2 n=1 Tax=Viridothelium virens TaxID=1048519 RepID=A0A6A6H8W3_VIRVR|nr:GINS complex, PSF2 component [Viridothelium virens]